MIKRLDGEVATKIAAGEVIERPVSVVKELLENSLDAAARTVTLQLEQGGKSSLVIEDDGCGIACDELPLALERYATSKISTIDDLERIATLGYRGEALASVAAVSRMEIRSRVAGADSGGVIRCEGGVITLHGEAPCHPGTRIQVEDLFYNIPARRKFMKTASAELRRVLQLVGDYVLIHPQITLRLYSDQKKILEHTAVSSVDERLEKKWGKEVKRHYCRLAEGDNTAHVWWNPMPDARRVTITLFVNGRRVQDATVRAAICGGDASAYGEWLVLLTLPPDRLDVNIHPTKEEIRFRRSQEVFKLIHNAARQVFGQRYEIQPAQFPAAGVAELMVQPPQQGYFERTRDLFLQEPWRPAGSIRVAAPAAKSEYVAAERPLGGGEAVNVSVQCLVKNYIGQSADGYLLFDFADGLAIMDPHAAHERILFEEICDTFKDEIITQKLALPQEIPEALRAEAAIAEDELRRLGFCIEEDGLTGVPMLQGRGRLSALELLRSALRGIEVEQDPAKRDRDVWWRMARLACRDAMKLGRRMERAEAEELLRRLERCEIPYTCPHGRPTVFLLPNKKLEEWFER